MLIYQRLCRSTRRLEGAENTVHGEGPRLHWTSRETGAQRPRTLIPGRIFSQRVKVSLAKLELFSLGPERELRGL